MNLLPGEELSGEFNNLQDSINLTDEDINNKYVLGEVRVVTEQARYPLTSIPTMIESGDYERNPEFQRRHRWDNEKKSRLMESFIMNVPIPPIFLYEDKFSHYEVMDGLQRLTAIYEFYKNKYAFTGLTEWPELNGKYYSELPAQIKKGIDRRYLSSIILLQETAKTPEEALKLKQLVFERINSGGVNLEPQESRNAIYNGPLNQLCIRLARNEYLCRLWDIPFDNTGNDQADLLPVKLLENETYKKMNDVELVLRFFAYRQRTRFQKGALKVYLDQFLKEGNLFPLSVLSAYETLFEETIKLVYQTLGNNAFKLYRKRESGWGWYNRPTTVLYDPIMYTFSQNLHKKETLLTKNKDIQEALIPFYQENYEKLEGRYTNISNINERNELFKGLLESFL